MGIQRLGLSGAFNVIYIGTAELFPTLFAATAFGYCNFFARTFTAGSSILAGIHEPVPMILLSILSLTASLLIWLLKTDMSPIKSKGKHQEKEGLEVKNE